MKKIFLITLLLFVAVFEVKAEFNYVRKQQTPDFFIPSGLLNKPEKLPMPKYTNTEKESVSNIKPENEMGRSPDVVAYNNHGLANYKAATKMVNPVGVDINVMQKYYDAYILDLQNIDETGKLPENQVLTQDLSEMVSNEKVLYKKFEVEN